MNDNEIKEQNNEKEKTNGNIYVLTNTGRSVLRENSLNRQQSYNSNNRTSVLRVNNQLDNFEENLENKKVR